MRDDVLREQSRTNEIFCKQLEGIALQQHNIHSSLHVRMIISRSLFFFAATKLSVLDISAAFIHRPRTISKGLGLLRLNLPPSFLRAPSSPTTLRMASSSLPSSPSDKGDLSNLRVALCQFHVTHDKKTNEETARKYLSQAKEKGAKMAVLPEIWNSPYATSAFPEYAETLPEIGDNLSEQSDSKWSSSASRLLMEAARELDMWIVGGSIPERVTTQKEEGMKEEKIYNTCLVLNPDGVVVAKHRKVHLFDIDVKGGITFFESETLSSGSTVSHFETPYGEIGVGICYDIRFAEYAMLLRQKHNCLVLVYPGAFNMTTGPAHWELLQQARAIDNQCFVITASPARSEESDSDSAKKYPHYTAWGHSTVVSPWGDIVATTDEKECVVVADLDLNRLAEVRAGIPIGNQRRTDLYTLEDTSSS